VDNGFVDGVRFVVSGFQYFVEQYVVAVVYHCFFAVFFLFKKIWTRDCVVVIVFCDVCVCGSRIKNLFDE
jgi:hypothetical protein